MVAVAIGGAAVVGAGASIAAGNKAAKAQKNAAQTAADANLTASREANELQKYMYDQTRTDYAPYRAVGEGALYKLADMYGVARPTTPTVMTSGEGGSPVSMTSGYEGFEASPGYQFRLDEGLKAIERSAAARGGLRSGATMKALNNYAQGQASSEYENYSNRLAALAGVGQTGTAATSAAGQNYANAAGANTMAAGNATGNAALAAGNARASAYQNTGNTIASTANNLAAMYLYQNNWGNGGFGGGTTTPAYAGYRG